MRTSVALLVAALLGLLLQTTILPSAPGLPLVPDLALVLAVYLAMFHQGIRGVVGAFLLGYALDTFSGTVLGVNAFALTLVYLAVYMVARTLWTEGGVPAMMVVFLAALLRGVATVAAAALVESPGPVWDQLTRHGVLDAFAAALVAPAVFAFVTWERRLLGGA
ncbi:MAG: rod shape-determining protein MreD [Candidatus Binatia bacterium]